MSSRTNRLSRSGRRSTHTQQHTPQHTQQTQTKPDTHRGQQQQFVAVDSTTDFKTPTRVTKSRYGGGFNAESRYGGGGGFNADSPFSDTEPQHDIIWDATSPSPIKTRGRKQGVRCRNVDISAIVKRIAPKHGRPAVPEPTLQQWIGENAAIPCTPSPDVHPPFKKKSPRTNGVEDLMKLAKQFDLNMFRQSETATPRSGHATTAPEDGVTLREDAAAPEDGVKLREERDQTLPHDDVEMEELHSGDGEQQAAVAPPPVKDNTAVCSPAHHRMEEDLDLDLDLDSIFDASTQHISGNLSQVSLSASLEGKPVPRLSSKEPCRNLVKEPYGNIKEPYGNIKQNTSGAVVAPAPATSSTQTQSRLENNMAAAAADDDWDDDDLLDDPSLLALTQDPPLLPPPPPMHCSTQRNPPLLPPPPPNQKNPRRSFLLQQDGSTFNQILTSISNHRPAALSRPDRQSGSSVSMETENRPNHNRSNPRVERSTTVTITTRSPSHPSATKPLPTRPAAPPHQTTGGAKPLPTRPTPAAPLHQTTGGTKPLPTRPTPAAPLHQTTGGTKPLPTRPTPAAPLHQTTGGAKPLPTRPTPTAPPHQPTGGAKPLPTRPEQAAAPHQPSGGDIELADDDLDSLFSEELLWDDDDDNQSEKLPRNSESQSEEPPRDGDSQSEEPPWDDEGQDDHLLLELCEGVEAANHSQAASHSRPTPANHSQAASHNRPTPANHIQAAAHNRPTPANHIQAASHNRPKPANHSQAAAHNRPTPANHSQAAAHSRPTPANHGQAASHNRPTPANHGQAASHNRPTPANHSQAASHNRPTPANSLSGHAPMSIYGHAPMSGSTSGGASGGLCVRSLPHKNPPPVKPASSSSSCGAGTASSSGSLQSSGGAAHPHRVAVEPPRILTAVHNNNNASTGRYTFKRPAGPAPTTTNTAGGKCSAEEIELKKRLAMERRRQKMQNSQNITAPT